MPLNVGEFVTKHNSPPNMVVTRFMTLLIAVLDEIKYWPSNGLCNIPPFD